MAPRYLNLFLDVRLATFYLSPQILTPTLPCVTSGLMRKKCKDMVINFLKYQPTVITPIQLNGIVIDRVSSYKLLGVIISNDLSWNHKKATKRLFVLRTFKRVGLGTNDLVLVYCSIFRSIVEYTSPVWAAIPLYLEESIESVQRKALKIIFGRVDYAEALVLSLIHI